LDGSSTSWSVSVTASDLAAVGVHCQVQLAILVGCSPAVFVGQPQPSNSTTDVIRPSAWRSASSNAVRSIRQVWIALSEYVACPPGVERGAAFQASMAASVTHSVRLPRRRSPASYSAQFVTWNLILEMWWRRSALCL